MIRSSAGRDIELVWQGIRSRRLPDEVQRIGLRKLAYPDRAKTLVDLREPPEINLSNYAAAGQGNGRSGSMTSGEFVFDGRMVMRRMLNPSTTTKVRKPDLLPIPTPGEILLEDFLKPAGLSQNALARAIGVPPRRINEIVLGKRAITADTDLRLARYYRISEGIFLGLQADYELRMQRRALGNKLDFIKPRAV